MCERGLVERGSTNLTTARRGDKAMGEWMESKKGDIMPGIQITEKVVGLGWRTVGEGEIIIPMIEVDTEAAVEVTIEEVGEAVIMEVVEAMWEERVEAVAITVKTTEVEEELVSMLVGTTVPAIKILITIGPWRTEVAATEVMEVTTVTAGVGTKLVVVEEAVILIMVADMTTTVIGKATMAIMTTPMVEEEEITGTVAEEEDLQSTQPRSWK